MDAMPPPIPSIDALLAHAPFVRAVARAAVRGDDQVDDIVQETWLAAITRGPTRPGPLGGWLARVARRRAADRLRRDSRRVGRETVAARPEALPATDEVAARAELGRSVIEAVLALDEPYRTAILLRYYDELPPREVAASTNVPVETARTHIKRGLAKLRASLDARHGHRRAWVVPLAAALPSSTTLSTGVLLGVLVKKLAPVWIVLALGGVAWLVLGEGASTPDARRAAPEVAGAPTLVGRGTLGPILVDDQVGAGRITGRVTRFGRPADAHVELRRLGAAPLSPPHVGSNADRLLEHDLAQGRPLRVVATQAGAFRFEVPRAGRYELRAIGKSGEVAARTAFLAPHAHAAVTLELPGGEVVLEGEVRYRDGRPFSGWVVAEGTRSWTSAGGILSTTTYYGERRMPLDAQGRFTLRGISPGMVRLAALAPGRERHVSATLTVPRSRPFVFVVDEDYVSRRGHVVDARTGQPVRNALVEMEGRREDGGDVQRRIRTGANGAFEVGMPRGRGHLHVRATGYAPYRRRLAGTQGPAEVRLVRAAEVTGRVVRAHDGRPQAGVLVNAVPERRPEAWRQTRTGEDGRYLLTDLPPGDVMVFAAGGGWITTPRSVRPEEGHEATMMRLEPGVRARRDFRVEPGVTVQGQVLDHEGTPVRGCVVAAEPMGDFPFATHGSPRWMGTGVTDAEGRFALSCLAPDVVYVFHAQAADRPHAMSDKLLVTADAPPAPTIRLAEPAVLRVRVLRGNDPVAGALVGAGTAWTYTDAEGRCRLQPLARRPVTPFVRARGCAQPMQREQVMPGEDEVVLRLEAAKSIAGRVAVPEGVPAGRVWIRANATERRRDVMGWGSTRAHPDGSFVLHGLPDGEYEIKASYWEGLAVEGKARAWAGDRGVSIELEPPTGTTTWHLAVRDVEGHAPAFARVRLHTKDRRGRWAARVHEVHDGVRVLSTRRPASGAWIEVYDTRDESGRPTGHGACRHLALPAEGGDVDVELDGARAVRGRILDDRGRPVPWVRVAAHLPVETGRDSDTDPDHAHGLARSDAEGAFTLRGLGRGAYVLHVEPPRAFVAPWHVALAPEATEVTVHLERAARAVLTLLLGDAPCAGAEVRVIDPITKRERDVESDARGRAELVGLQADRPYRLEIERGDPPRIAPLVREAWIPRTETLQLRRAVRVHGSVLRAPGQEAMRVRVLWRRPGRERWEHARLEKNDTFVTGWAAEGEEIALVAREAVGVISAHVPDHAITRARAGDGAASLPITSPLRLVVRTIGEGLQRTSVCYIHEEDVAPDARKLHGQGFGERDHVVFAGLRPDARYSIYITGLTDGRYGAAEGVAGRAGEVSVTLEPGGAITGRVSTPPKKTAWVVAQWKGFSFWRSTAKDGSFRIDGLRPGAWTVRARRPAPTANDKQKMLERSQATRTGAHVHFDLR